MHGLCVRARLALGRTAQPATGRECVLVGGYVACLLTPQYRNVLEQLGGKIEVVRSRGFLTVLDASGDRR